MNELAWCTGEMMLIGKNGSASRKFCPSDCGVNANLCQFLLFAGLNKFCYILLYKTHEFDCHFGCEAWLTEG
jgi:hypothetical protein